MPFLHVWQFDPGGWAGYVGSLIGAGTVGLLLREALRLAFARADKNDDNATVKRGELREQVAWLTNRVDELTLRLDSANDRANALFATQEAMRTENVLLRNRYHRLLGYVQTLTLTLDHYAERLGVPDHERPRIPPWIDEGVPGPTAREIPPEATRDT